MPTAIKMASGNSTPRKSGRLIRKEAERKVIPEVKETPKKSKNTPKKGLTKETPQKSKDVPKEVSKKQTPKALEVEVSEASSEENTPEKEPVESQKRSASKPTVNYNEESDEEDEETASSEKSVSNAPKKRGRTSKPTVNYNEESAEEDEETASSEKSVSKSPKKRGRTSKNTGNIKPPEEVLKKRGRPSRGEITPKTPSKVTSSKQRSDPASRKVHPEIELLDLPSADKILKWASEYKKKLSSSEGKFMAVQQALCKRVMSKLSKLGVSTSNKNPLEALEKFLYGTQREAGFAEGLNVETLWLIASWRYLRGPHKSGILTMIMSNEDDKVRNITRSVYKQVDTALNSFQKGKGSNVFCSKYSESIKGWVSSLTEISGVSHTTATAILSIFTDQIPYMSKEGIKASMGTGMSLHQSSTLDAYLKHTVLVADKMKGKLSAREIESAWFSKSQ